MSDHRLPPWPAAFEPRPWQHAFLDAARRFFRARRKTFFLAACPGAGKTPAALMLARDLIARGEVARFVVVVHTDYLRTQWLDVCAQVGLPATVDIPRSNREWPAGVYGLVLTYQQLLSPAVAPAVRSLVTHRTPYCVVCDEMHHVGDSKAWDTAIKYAFEFAHRRLCQTGTPSRFDGLPLPWASYDRRNRLVVQYSLSYGEALAERYVVPAYFHVYDVEATLRREEEVLTAGFSDNRLSLNAVLDNPAWLRTVIADAHAQLQRLREDGSNVAGLIVARDVMDAGAVAALVEKTTGERAVVVTYEEPDAAQRIEAFKSSNAWWLVTVKMVGEGVDIPRLKALVWASNVRTDVFFWQVIGRCIRRFGLGLSAHLFIPADPHLLEYAKELYDMRLQVLPVARPKRPVIVRESAPIEQGGGGSPPRRASRSSRRAPWRARCWPAWRNSPRLRSKRRWRSSGRPVWFATRRRSWRAGCASSRQRRCSRRTPSRSAAARTTPRREMRPGCCARSARAHPGKTRPNQTPKPGIGGILEGGRRTDPFYRQHCKFENG